LDALTRLEVLDLHGNQLTSLAGLSPLADLKVLNAAGNQLRMVTENELRGLSALEELNLRRNRIRRVEGIGHATKLVKLFLSNNNITTYVQFKSLVYFSVLLWQTFSSVEELSGVRKAGQLKELSIDGNPVSEIAECTAALVSSLPHLKLLNGTNVTSDLRNVAQSWQQEPASDKTQVY
jgi:leucine-rich repeat-containing protein 49